MPDTLLWIKLAAVPILIAVNAFFVAAEYAIVTIRTTRVEELKSQGVAAARVLARLKHDLGGALAAIQVCITATNLLIGAVAEPALTALIVGALRPLEIVVPAGLARPIGLAVGLVLVTFFTVLLSELLPKALTLQYTDAIALRVARPVAVCRAACNPLVQMLNWSGNRVTRALGLGQVRIEDPIHSEEELEMLVDRADDAGEFHVEHGDLLRRAFDFADLNVRHVMIPISRAGMLDGNQTPREVIHRVVDWPYTRWPVRDARSGQITGIVNIKLVLHAMALNAGDALILHDLAVEPTYVAPDLPLVDALAEMRRTRRHVAIVRERDGPDLGIVTLEDILGAIVGKIPSELKRPVGPR